jgi:hypothetical protein
MATDGRDVATVVVGGERRMRREDHAVSVRRKARVL